MDRCRPRRTATVRVVVAAATCAATLGVIAGGCSAPNRSVGGSTGDHAGRHNQPGSESLSDTTPGAPDNTGADSAGSEAPSTEPEASASAALVDTVCAGSATVEDVGTVSSELIDEASGLAASRINDGVWWTHNDSGGRPELYALGSDARLLAVLTISGAEAIDWEDIATATGANRTASIYIADIGDNKAERDHVTIYRVTEPRIDANASGGVRRLTAAAVPIDLTYPDGPRDAEALMVDASDRSENVTGYVIDKDWSMGGRSNIYRAELDGRGSTDTESTGGGPIAARSMTKVGELRLPPGSLVTASDMSSDGTAIAIRAYGAEYVWSRAVGQSVPATLSTPGCRGPHLPELQGEAIAFAPDGRSYVTVAEGQRRTLHRVVG